MSIVIGGKRDIYYCQSETEAKILCNIFDGSTRGNMIKGSYREHRHGFMFSIERWDVPITQVLQHVSMVLAGELLYYTANQKQPE